MSALVSTFTPLSGLLLAVGGIVFVLGVLFIVAIRQRNLHLWLDDSLDPSLLAALWVKDPTQMKRRNLPK